jgi:hypothetical protein
VSVQAPDVAGVIDAWRVWQVVPRDGGYLLASALREKLWLPGRVLHARCLREVPERTWAPRHAAPVAGCDCGVYGAGLSLIARYLDDDAMPAAGSRVLGVVSLWGTVVECEKGFRASHAYPKRIYVPRDTRCARRARPTAELAAGLGVYGVPVDVLGVPRAEAARELARS